MLHKKSQYTPPAAPATPATPAKPTQIDQKKVNELKKYDQQVKTLTDNIQKNMQKIFAHNERNICLLRLDMVADKLECINPRWASQIDSITSAIESADWKY